MKAFLYRIFHPPSWSIVVKLIIAFSLTSLLPLAFLGWCSFTVAKETLLIEKRSMLTSQANELVRHLDILLVERISSIKLLSKSETVKSFAASWPNPTKHDQLETQKILDNFADSNPYFQAVYIMNRQGEVILSTVENTGQNLDSCVCFQKAMAGNTYISDISISMDSGDPALYFCAPIKEEDGEIHAATILQVHAEEVWSLIELEKNTLGIGSVAILFDEYGIRIAHASDRSLIFKSVVPLDPQLEAQLLAEQRFGTMDRIESTNFPELAEGLFSVEKPTLFTHHLIISDTLYHASAIRLTMKPWTVIQTVPESAFLSTVNQIRQITLIITVITAVLMLAFINLSISHMTKPLKKLTLSAKQITEGQLDISLKDINIQQGDEIGVLFQSLKAMQSSLTASYARLEEAYLITIEALSSALDVRDRETEGHSRRVTFMSMRIAEELRLDSSERQALLRGALLHDVGKIGISDTILLKTGALTEQEWAIMKRHPMIGYKILKDIKFLEDSLSVVISHHEKFDGSGYPYGLSGTNIPLNARIFSVADAYDAITNERPYKKAKSHEEAVAEIKRSSGTHFDPEIVEVFIKLFTRENGEDA